MLPDEELAADLYDATGEEAARFGLLGIIANALPVCAVLGLMGWLGISLNVATVMVASVALGIVDDGAASSTVVWPIKTARRARAAASW